MKNRCQGYNTRWLVRAITGFLVLFFAECGFAQTPSQLEKQAPEAQSGTDPMDSLLEFGATPSDQLPPPPETNVLQLLIMESSELRDPFWPVGYVPPAPTQAASSTSVVELATEVVVDEEPRWDEALRSVSVRGIMSVGGGKYMAVVNNEVVGEGDSVSVSHNNRRYSWRINSITAQGVKFQKMTVSR